MNRLLSANPLLVPALAFIAGIISAKSGISVWWAFIPLATAVIFLLLRRFFIAAISLIFIAGIADMTMQMPQPLPFSLIDVEIPLSGVVTEAKETESAQLLTLKIDSIGENPCRKFLISATIPIMTKTAEENDRLRFNGKIEPINPVCWLPDEIDYDKYLSTKGVSGKVFIEPDNMIGMEKEPGVMNDIRRFRHRISHILFNAPLSENTAVFLNTTFTGDKNLIEDDVRTLLSSVGLAHILALSGLHVGVIAWIIAILLFPLFLTGHRTARSIITIITLWLFAIMTGLSASVVRAVVMASVIVLAAILQRARSSVNSLCLAALVILVFDPSALWAVGFQLSFAAVLAIVLIADKINPVSHRYAVARYFTDIIAVTIAATLGTSVISVYYFHVFPVYFLLANAFAIFLLPFLLAAGVAVILLSASGIPCGWACASADSIYGVILRWNEFISHIPGATVENLYPSAISVWIVVAAVLFLALFLHSRRPAALIAAVMTGLTAVVTAFMLSPTYPEREAYLTAFTRSTQLLAKEGNNLYLFTTVGEQDLEDVKARCNRRYRDYMHRRNIDSLTVLPPVFQSDFISRSGCRINVAGKSYLFINSSEIFPYGETDYIVVCRGYRGDICNLARHAGSGLMLLSPDLDPRRLKRYVAELTENKIPFVCLGPTSSQKLLSREVHDNPH